LYLTIEALIDIGNHLISDEDLGNENLSDLKEILQKYANFL